MHCPKCGMELPEGTLYCEQCGEDIHIVPDYDPEIDLNIDFALEKIGNQIEEDINLGKKKIEPGKMPEKKPVSPSARRRFHAWVIFLVGLSAVIMVLIYVSWLSMEHYNSAPYQIEQAESFTSLGEYDKAIACYGRAIEIKGEDLEIIGRMSDLYFMKNDQANYELCLKRILHSKEASQEMLASARVKMIRYLIKKGDFDSINKLLIESNDPVLQEEYQSYMSLEPELSLASGVYEGMQSLKITGSGDGAIYYTLDGTIPGENGTEYILPIILDFGSVTVRACYINQYGVKSRIAEAQYTIEQAFEGAQ